MKAKSNVLKIVLIATGAIALTVGGIFVYKKFFAKPAEDAADDTSGGDTGSTSSSSSSSADEAAKALLAGIGGGSSAPSVVASIPKTLPSKPVSNYSKGQRVYARMNSGLYSSPSLRSANITHQVKKDQPIGMFEKASVNDFAYLTVVLKDANGKYVPMIKYIPMAAIRPARIAQGEKN